MTERPPVSVSPALGPSLRSRWASASHRCRQSPHAALGDDRHCRRRRHVEGGIRHSDVGGAGVHRLSVTFLPVPRSAWCNLVRRTHRVAVHVRGGRRQCCRTGPDFVDHATVRQDAVGPDDERVGAPRVQLVAKAASVVSVTAVLSASVSATPTPSPPGRDSATSTASAQRRRPLHGLSRTETALRYGRRHVRRRRPRQPGLRSPRGSAPRSRPAQQPPAIRQ